MNIQITPGSPFPFGANIQEGKVNFALYAKNIEKISLCLFNENDPLNPFKEIELEPSLNKTGNVWHIAIESLPPYTLYAFRVPVENSNYLLIDPYAKSIYSSPDWGNAKPYSPLGRIIPLTTFDWEGIPSPKLPSKDLIIYEMHIRGLTQDQSSQVSHPGTYLGVIEKIPYLKELGINAVELMPIYEFNESEALQINPKTQQKLVNYFGYSTVNFFSPMNRYASEIQENKTLVEFKTMVKELHRHGIEVILDVVYNHTFEGNQMGPIQSFRGLDKHAYYMIDEQGNYLNFSGCGNTFNANHPIVKEFIIQSLRYWVTEMRVDGFRFDLASILCRSENGTPLNPSPLIEAISHDPILSQTKLIAEAWDAGGLYQVGGFYPGQRWAEWNGHYRDIVRRFIKGTSGHKTAFATALSGSQDLYGWRGTPCCSINFITAHDGFSLADLVTYNDKHNLDNGEENRDGFDHNDSWNCGIEGHSNNKKIVALRERQIRNFLLALLVSQGIPMILMGDEYAHTRDGNNNTWCQDNKLNWFLWDKLLEKQSVFRFFKSLITFRKNYPLLKRDTFLEETDVTWHGQVPFNPDWENDNKFIAFSLNIPHEGPDLYVAFNASHVVLTVTIPPARQGMHWVWLVNTHNVAPGDFFEESCRKRVNSNTLKIPSYTSIALKAEVDRS
ncbi:glycogen debranching protein [Candidatus Protochlamydia amoebophila]|uniref:Glycosyl hydrolase family 13 catalytic domain-containing protein n=1 Tax=Protochlamydia amoebophila (strain UWE25) TaxID=264201 RepID=Q6MC69_PARUW|nr:isoamylase [Candidatus Protochlamydia amoebophila]CAF23830.1 unnamed protein product [Candidatus Protochlamydia amoebophila UWE25]